MLKLKNKNTMILLLLVILGVLLVVYFFGRAARRDSFLDPRIIGGAPIPHDRVPFFVQMVAKFPNESNWSHGCGGTLISDRHVLIAAHCVSVMQADGYQFAIHALEEGRIRRIGIENYKIFPGKFTNARDVAVIKLQRSVKNASTLKLGKKIPKKNDSLVLVGKGVYTHDGDMPRDIQMTRLRVDHIAFNNRVIVALTEGTSGCPGDSGGPLFENDVIYGIVSGAISNPGRPGYHIACEKTGSGMYAGRYTAVAPKVKWIQRAMKELGK